MTKKYYYDCPIKAAYMNHEFGVITYIELSINDKVYDKCLIKNWNNRELELDEKNKYYVSPESEHIFQPKEGDIGIIKNFNPLIFVRFFSYYNSWNYEDDEYEERFNNDDVKIIYRDNKHFFNPKEEN